MASHGIGSQSLGESDATAVYSAAEAIAIAPAARHSITNSGNDVLRFLCCCAPGYEHDDTVMADSM